MVSICLVYESCLSHGNAQIADENLITPTQDQGSVLFDAMLHASDLGWLVFLCLSRGRQCRSSKIFIEDYWGVEQPPADAGWLCSVWFHQDLSPHRKGIEEMESN